MILGGLTALGAVAIGGACASDTPEAATTSSPASTSGASAIASGGTIAATDCVLTPEQMEGPFYLDDALARQDITEGKPGVPLLLELVVADAAQCTPMGDVAVDIWHCDALGEYSGYGEVTMAAAHVEPTNTLTFLRGTQITDADGRCTFTTIVPGWYTGRAVHIHVKVHPTPDTQATTQLYVPEDVLATVFATDPYSQHAGPHIPYDRDALNEGSTPPALLALTPDANGYAASFTVGVAA